MAPDMSAGIQLAREHGGERLGGQWVIGEEVPHPDFALTSEQVRTHAGLTFLWHRRHDRTKSYGWYFAAPAAADCGPHWAMTHETAAGLEGRDLDGPARARC